MGGNIMVDKRNKNKSLVVSSLVTLSVIAMLIASVPASAVTVSISGLSGSITQGTPKTFLVAVTMDSPDKFVPVSNITLRINGPTTKQWTFDPIHGILTGQSSDKNITIKVISPPSKEQFGYGYGYGVDTVGYGYGYNFGYGYGYNFGYGYGYNFGYGYGYGYNNGQGGGRISFIYQITLLTTDLAAGSYTATAFLNTGNPAKANFASSDTSFTIVPRSIQEKGNISGFKINAANGMGLQGWTIRLIGIVGKGTGTRVIRMDTTTNADGSYMFNDLPAGRYILREELQRGFVPVGSPVKNIMLTLGENSMNNNFTNRPI
jgi:hypothetical protein